MAMLPLAPSQCRCSLVLLALFALLRVPGQAQVLYGSLVGSVQDSSGAVVPGATVRITNRGTEQSRSTVANESGSYEFANVLAGQYTIEVQATGFRAMQRTGIEVVVNTVRREDFQLQVGQVTEVLTVAGTATVLQTEKVDVSVDIGSEAIENLPLGDYRNYQSLIDLVPGATPAEFQNAILSRPGRALTTNINGTNRNNNTTKLDGATNMSVWLPHHVAYVAPADTIETVNVATNNFDAEQGMAGGAAITVVTKSGTNQLHGTLFAYHDDQALRARNFFERTAQKPKHIRNMDGLTIGGPIKRNRVFFFGGWESSRERTSRVGFYTVPTGDQREGNFINYRTTIYDPATGTQDGKGRTPFPGNAVPLGRQSAAARRIQDLVLAPNLPGVSSNYYATAAQTLDRDQADVKVTWNRNSAHTVWAKYSIMNAPVSCKAAFGRIGGPGLCDSGSGTGSNRAQLATVGHTYTLSPTIVIDGTLGYTRNRIDVMPSGYGSNVGLDVFKIPGTNGKDIRQSGVPVISISGYTQFGDLDSWNPAFHRDQSYTFSQNLGWSHGAHSIRFGGEMARHQLNHWQPELGSGPRGGFTFAQGPTVLNGGAAGNSYNSYATFLLGLVTTASKSMQWETMTTREWQFGLYFRDRWQVSRRTTAVLGVRYELFPLLRRSHTGIEFWDPETNIVSRGGLGGNPEGLGITTSHKLFAPRAGLTHRLTEKTVVRGGYGISYNPMVLSRPMRGSYPLTIDASFPAANTYRWFGTLDEGIPEFSGEDPKSGSFPLPARYSIRTLWQPNGGRHVDRGYIQSWNVIVDRQMPGDLVVGIGYVGTRTIRGFLDWEGNSSPPGTGLAGSPFYQRFGLTNSILLFNGAARANYHALQIAFNRNFRGGLMIKGAFTRSKAMNEFDDDGWGSPLWNWAPVRNRNYAVAGYDIPRNLQLAVVYKLPLGKGRRFFTHGWSGRAFYGWQVNGTFYSYDGRPFTVTGPSTSLNSRSNQQTADQVKPVVEKIGDVGPGTRFYDPTAFAAVREVRFGTTGRNILRSPGSIGLNGSVFRQFRVSERASLEFRAEAFNVSNTPRFGRPNADISSSSFMQVNSASGQRQFRFALRVRY